MKLYLISLLLFIALFSQAQEKTRNLYTGGSYSLNGGPFPAMQHFNVHIGVSFKRKFFWQLGTGYHNQIVHPYGRRKDFGYWTSNLTYKYRFFAKKSWLISPMLQLEAGIGYPNHRNKVTIEGGEFAGSNIADPENYFRSVNYFSPQLVADIKLHYSHLQLGGGIALNNVQTVKGRSGRGYPIWIVSVSYSYLLHKKDRTNK